jgi:hypothetical protein
LATFSFQTFSGFIWNLNGFWIFYLVLALVKFLPSDPKPQLLAKTLPSISRTQIPFKLFSITLFFYLGI